MDEGVHGLLCGPQPCPHALHIPTGSHGRKGEMRGLWSDSMRTVRTCAP